MQLEYTALWFANSQHRQQSGAGQSVRVIIKVLPRLAGAAQLRQDVERLHQRFKLWGGTLRVSAPNDPQLCRCSQCDQLGHQASQLAALLVLWPFQLLSALWRGDGLCDCLVS